MAWLIGEGSSQGASDEDDVPIITAPKPPADQPIKDDDSLLALRCKLFYKKDDSYVELGEMLCYGGVQLLL